MQGAPTEGFELAGPQSRAGCAGPSRACLPACWVQLMGLGSPCRGAVCKGRLGSVGLC